MSCCPFCGADLHDYIDEYSKEPVDVACCTAGSALFNENVGMLQEAAELICNGDTMDVERGRELVVKFEML